MSGLPRLPHLPGQRLYRHSRGDHTRGTARSALGWDEWEEGRAVVPFRHGAHSHQLIVPADGFRDVGLRHPHSLQREINIAPDGEVGVQRDQLPRVLGLPADRTCSGRGAVPSWGWGWGGGVSHQGGAHLDDEPGGHGGQVLLQSQFEIFINLIWNRDRQNMELRCFLGGVEGSMG